MRHNVLTLADPEAVAEAAAEILIAAADAAVESRGRFVLVLSGGSTPRTLYDLLARAEYGARVPWQHTHLLFGDERCVPPDDDDSNYRMAKEHLIDRLPIPAEQVHRMQGELPQASRAAHFYEQELRELYPDADLPRFGVVLLGMGEDGHTASLFPATDALAERERWVVGNYLADPGIWRITMTLPALCAAEHILFMVTGENKAPIVAEAFGGVPHDEPYPAELVVPIDGTREVLLDRAAASMLPID